MTLQTVRPLVVITTTGSQWEIGIVRLWPVRMELCSVPILRYNGSNESLRAIVSNIATLLIDVVCGKHNYTPLCPDEK